MNASLIILMVQMLSMGVSMGTDIDPATVPLPQKSVRFKEEVTKSLYQKNDHEIPEGDVVQDIKTEGEIIPLRPESGLSFEFDSYDSPSKNRLFGKICKIRIYSESIGRYSIKLNVLDRIGTILESHLDDLVYDSICELVEAVLISHVHYIASTVVYQSRARDAKDYKDLLEKWDGFGYLMPSFVKERKKALKEKLVPLLPDLDGSLENMKKLSEDKKSIYTEAYAELEKTTKEISDGIKLEAMNKALDDLTLVVEGIGSKSLKLVPSSTNLVSYLEATEPPSKPLEQIVAEINSGESAQ